MTDYELNDTPCPKCNHEPTHVESCSAVGCDDGWIDMHEFDDPLWFSPGDVERCDECNGRGFIEWCPECGYVFTGDEVVAEHQDKSMEVGK